MREYAIYVLTSPSGKQYVGQTQDFCKRIKAHEYATKYRDTPLYQAIRKYGWQNFDKRIVANNLTAEDVDCHERHWIQRLNTLAPNGYNLDSGGNTNKTHSEETKRKISEIQIGRTLPEKHRVNISKGMLGKTIPPEVVLKRFETRIGMSPLSLHIEIQLYLRAGWSRRRIHRDVGWAMETIGKYKDLPV